MYATQTPRLFCTAKALFRASSKLVHVDFSPNEMLSTGQ